MASTGVQMASLNKSKKATDAKLKRLWTAMASKMTQINELGCHGGVMATIKGKILTAGSPGSSMLEHRHLLSEKATEDTLPCHSPRSLFCLPSWRICRRGHCEAGLQTMFEHLLVN
eukprot:scpid107070/ scgid35415/ 